jgi:AhpD family alkylhydroperoxidase
MMHHRSQIRILTIVLAGALSAACAESVASPPAGDKTTAGTPALAAVLEAAKARVGAAARVPLAAGNPVSAPEMRLYGPDTPSYVQALGAMPQAAAPMAELVHTVLWRGVLPTDVKAGMGLRIAGINGSPYVAAHMARVLRATASGRELLDTLVAGAEPDAGTPAGLAVRYADLLTRNIHGVTDTDFARVRGSYDDSAIVELTIVTAFFNYFTRFAEALRLPVESWVFDAPPAWPAGPASQPARVGLISDDEMAATAVLREAALDGPSPRTGLGLGIANSQRAMMRSPALGRAWRAVFGLAYGEPATVGRDLKLHVSFAVSMANGCRYCTLHQVQGLRRLGVDPAKLVAMKKDDSALSPRELVAVTFARTLTTNPSAVSDADYEALRREFGERGALEVVMQTCNFAFMNRFTDGLRLPSEDEAVKAYLDTYGTNYGD